MVLAQIRQYGNPVFDPLQCSKDRGVSNPEPERDNLGNAIAVKCLLAPAIGTLRDAPQAPVSKGVTYCLAKFVSGYAHLSHSPLSNRVNGSLGVLEGTAFLVSS
jgi:hypothetical protein